jgi:Ran GTPase-activating protein (RanGAP) involved in mRNA processing and transport
MSTISDEKFIAGILGSRDDANNEEIVYIDKFIGNEQMLLLISRLTNSSSLRNKRRLCLRGNCIGAAGAKALADMLRTNTHIEHVSLEWNQIGSSGCISIAEALKYNNTLKYLDLRNNGIGDDGAAALANALAASSKCLKVLDLRWNQVRKCM